MATLYLGLGSNLGNRADMLEQAIGLIEDKVGQVTARSRFYETQAWGFQSEHPFLNACIRVETPFSPIECLHLTQEIERLLGRSEKSVGGIYHDRCIDIDLLLYDRIEMHTEELTLPHPLMRQREFVTVPLREIGGLTD